MSFSYFARKVRNDRISIWTRLAALRSCIRLLSTHTGEQYHVALKRYDAKFGFDRDRGNPIGPPTIEQLVAALKAIEEERNGFVKQLKESNH